MTFGQGLIFGSALPGCHGLRVSGVTSSFSFTVCYSSLRNQVYSGSSFLSSAHFRSCCLQHGLKTETDTETTSLHKMIMLNPKAPMYTAAEEGSSCTVGVGYPAVVLIWTQVCPFLILKRTHQGERRRALECARRASIGSGVTYDCRQAKTSWACQSARPIVRASLKCYRQQY